MTAPAPHHPLSRDDVIGVVGALDDGKVVAIIETGGTLEDLVEAYSWAADETDALADAGKSLSGTVAHIYDILMAGEEWGEEQ